MQAFAPNHAHWNDGMKWVALAVALALFLPFAEWMRRHPRYIPWLWMCIGIVPFAQSAVPELGMAIVAWKDWPGFAKGIDISALDPGGTPCSQCIVGSCCSETESCLADFQCAGAMGCFQECAINGNPPDLCTQNCCPDAICSQWTSCVAASCGALCF